MIFSIVRDGRDSSEPAWPRRSSCNAERDARAWIASSREVRLRLAGIVLTRKAYPSDDRRVAQIHKQMMLFGLIRQHPTIHCMYEPTFRGLAMGLPLLEDP